MTEKKKTLGRAALTGGGGLKTKIVKVEEWAGDIRLRELSAADIGEASRYDVGSLATDPRAGLRAMAWLVSRSWVDEDGDLVLDDQTGIDDLLKTQRADLIARLGNEVSELSGLRPAAVADAEKNSASSQSDDSGTP
jgi:hypothetical protein